MRLGGTLSVLAILLATTLGMGCSPAAEISGTIPAEGPAGADLAPARGRIAVHMAPS